MRMLMVVLFLDSEFFSSFHAACSMQRLSRLIFFLVWRRSIQRLTNRSPHTKISVGSYRDIERNYKADELTTHSTTNQPISR